ncbi:hypothetical protein [Parasitella parasitica]|uniref:Uncharacterized protein n=1 Tax=Parasitella parasitica TaxID=35722 RepID=A0A0B7N4C4_9FUNG|nr:hypothetical protein [Parasitella parasitica]
MQLVFIRSYPPGHETTNILHGFIFQPTNPPDLTTSPEDETSPDDETGQAPAAADDTAKLTALSITEEDEAADSDNMCKTLVGSLDLIPVPQTWWETSC